MKISVKSFNIVFKILYLSFVSALFIAIIVLYFLGVNTADKKTSFKFDMATLGCAAAFLISMAAVVFLLQGKMIKIDKNVKQFINENNFDGAFNFLKGCASKKQLDTVNQLILYYSGYIE